MNCQRFWDTMPELGREAPAGEAREHMEHCPLVRRFVGAPPGIGGRLWAGWPWNRAPWRATPGGSQAAGKLSRPSRFEARAPPDWWVPLATWSAAAAA